MVVVVIKYICSICYYSLQPNSLFFQTLEDDVDSYVSMVSSLGKEATRLVSSDHFDSTNIKARKVKGNIYWFVSFLTLLMPTFFFFFFYNPRIN